MAKRYIFISLLSGKPCDLHPNQDQQRLGARFLYWDGGMQWRRAGARNFICCILSVLVYLCPVVLDDILYTCTVQRALTRDQDYGGVGWQRDVLLLHPWFCPLTTCIFGACFLLSCSLDKSKSLRTTAHLIGGSTSYPHIRLHFPGIRGGLKGPVVPLLNCPLIPRKCCWLDPSHTAVWWYRERRSVFLQSFAEQGPAWFSVAILAKTFCGFWVKDSLDFCHIQAKARLLPPWDEEGEEQAMARSCLLLLLP